ncbi:hypothetical protein [Neobacillus sp. SuZ13]|uniref:hypothetical protein n=1 Tax=Neobacillus sp. SuZ13 TaxID=3047875 RepID=UPI0032DE7F11
MTESIDRELLEIAPQLKVLSNMAVGYNNIDIVAKRKRHNGDEYSRCFIRKNSRLDVCPVDGNSTKTSRIIRLFKKRKLENLVTYAISGTGYLWGNHWYYRYGKNGASLAKRALI